MDNMIIVQFGSLLLILFIAFILYFTRLWKSGGLFNSSDMISILVQFVLIVWAIVSFFIGLTKVVIASGISSLTITLTLGIPLLIIIFFSLKIYRNYSKTKVELRKIKDASEICKKWAFSFPFVSQNNTQFKLYLRKGSPAGKIIITDVTKEQATELYSEKTNLPSGILLEVYTKSENDGDFIH